MLAQRKAQVPARFPHGHMKDSLPARLSEPRVNDLVCRSPESTKNEDDLARSFRLSLFVQAISSFQVTEGALFSPRTGASSVQRRRS